MKSVVFNGKFLAAPTTAVHRVADELILALDKILAEPGQDIDAAVLAPLTAYQPTSYTTMPVVKRGRLSGVFKGIPWEQISLPWMARRSVLINLCNLGPVSHGNAITMFHDAHVYVTPESWSWKFRLWYKFIQPLLGRRAKAIVTVSDYSKQQIAKYGLAAPEKIDIVYNGCDHVLRIEPDAGFVARSGLSQRKYVLALSNTQSHKNIGILLKAFATPALKDLALVLFGAAGKEDFERLGHSVPDNVIFVGRVSDAELVALMKKASAFACPSLTEGFGLPPLEAMALGCPAIIAPCGSLPEVCGNAALPADPDDPDEWARAIQRIVDEPALADALRAAGHKRASEFTWERAGRKLLAIINSLPER